MITVMIIIIVALYGWLVLFCVYVFVVDFYLFVFVLFCFFFLCFGDRRDHELIFVVYYYNEYYYKDNILCHVNHVSTHHS